MERNIIPVREFFDLLRSGLDVLFAMGRFGQDRYCVTICRHLLKDSKYFGLRLFKCPDGEITTGQAYAILNVIRIEFTRLFQKRGGTKRRGIVLPHCSDSLEGDRVLRV